MTNTNFFVEVGNVTRDIQDADYGVVGNGIARLNFSIAVNRSKKQGDQWIDEVSYLPFTCWGKTAENMRNFLRKGTKVIVTGYIKQDRWEKDGQKQSKLSLVAESVELCGTPSGNNNQNNAPQMQNNYQQPVQNSQPQNNGFQPIPSYNGPTANGPQYDSMGYPADIPF